MSRAVAAASFAFCIVISGVLAACAAPGDPVPPHPIVPGPISDLTVRQSGNAVALAFTVPLKSTDGEPLNQSASIEIYRAAIAAGGAVDRKTPWRLVYAVPAERIATYESAGHFDFSDPLAADALSNGSGTELAYTVRSALDKRHVSSDSNFATLRIYTPPLVISGLRAVVTETAVELSWDSPPLSGATPITGYRVLRALVEPGSEAARVSASASDAAQSTLKSHFAVIGTSDSASSTSFHDSHFEFGSRYAYLVRSIARFGADEVESADSTPVLIDARDIFPPASPSGLQAVTVPPTPQRAGYVELSWAIGSEDDLAGYYVYRSDTAEVRGERITGELLVTPTFRDISSVPGKHYWYRVSAVDRAGNESPASAPVQDE